ncbi:uncharacterized protein K444DRAFT_342998 [Hyaloscypha bicolor E]|uniref:Uncharacterized protein n=1 Tax=Hyaloscypha bicolor E TaxID=1095630 RepID=A0A2J6THG5_9HELO|nr:uncharacterized protein K444DRAFT_342998 [Hyaloscypha bicolor E]PMD62475.1 hypothetical protein K444DRAFT_342998 [Hyaloscypha bicolor E]
MVALVGAVATPPPPRTPTRPYPASSLTFLCAEISTTLARLASRQRAKKSPIFVLILLSLEGKARGYRLPGLEIPQSHHGSHPELPPSPSEMTPSQIVDAPSVADMALFLPPLSSSSSSRKFTLPGLASSKHVAS